MTDDQKNRINLPLLLPSGLLILEIIVVVVLLRSGYEISGLIFILLILLGLFLIFQISRQLWFGRQINKGIAGMKKAAELIQAGKPLEAIKQWKKILLALPREKYLDVLTQMEKVYESLKMEKAVQQIKIIQSESIEFFETVKVIKGFSPNERQKWLAKVFKLQKMIKTLPVEKSEVLQDNQTQD